jgi:hypothetical protein
MSEPFGDDFLAAKMRRVQAGDLSDPGHCSRRIRLVGRDDAHSASPTRTPTPHPVFLMSQPSSIRDQSEGDGRL